MRVRVRKKKKTENLSHKGKGGKVHIDVWATNYRKHSLKEKHSGYDNMKNKKQTVSKRDSRKEPQVL